MRFIFYKLCFISIYIISSCNTETTKSKAEEFSSSRVQANHDCIFDARGFNMQYLENDTSFFEFSWDSLSQTALGKMKNGFQMSCIVHVCDTWGFEANFCRYNPKNDDEITLPIILDLFKKLPTTPDKEKFLKVIRSKINEIELDDTTKVKRINLSIFDENEFFIDLSHENDTTYVSILMNSYY